MPFGKLRVMEDPYKIREEIERQFRESMERFNDLPAEEQKIIEERKGELTDKVKLMLDEINFEITAITTTYLENFETKDGARINAYNTTFICYETLMAIGVVTNAATMKMLYVQTRPMKYLSIEEFFELE